MHASTPAPSRRASACQDLRQACGMSVEPRIHRHRGAVRAFALPAVLAALAFSACGSSENEPSSGNAAASSSGANVAAAKEVIAPYTGKTSPFTVTEPLGKPLPRGTKFVFLQSATPIGALWGQMLDQAVTAIGGSYRGINAGTTASSAQAAASSALSLRPGGVLVPALVPSVFGDGLKRLRAGGAAVVGTGMIGAEPYGVEFNVAGEEYFALTGKLLADWVIANKGAEANAVFFTIPELPFTDVQLKGFRDEMKQNCSGCEVRAVPVSVTSIGKTAPTTIANDLQSHSDTNVAVFASAESAQGLPTALRSAGIEMTTVGAFPTPQNLQEIKIGGLTAGLAADLGVQAWSQIDAAARLVLGEEPLKSAESVPLQFLEQKDITFDTTKGWSGYPDFRERFAKLWLRG
jgi:ribose transport system substrate-binding protein